LLAHCLSYSPRACAKVPRGVLRGAYTIHSPIAIHCYCTLSGSLTTPPSTRLQRLVVPLYFRLLQPTCNPQAAQLRNTGCLHACSSKFACASSYRHAAALGKEPLCLPEKMPQPHFPARESQTPRLRAASPRGRRRGEEYSDRNMSFSFCTARVRPCVNKHKGFDKWAVGGNGREKPVNPRPGPVTLDLDNA